MLTKVHTGLDPVEGVWWKPAHKTEKVWVAIAFGWLSVQITTETVGARLRVSSCATAQRGWRGDAMPPALTSLWGRPSLRRCWATSPASSSLI